MLWLEIVLTAVVLVSTVGVIYNAFAISVTERTREFGLLRAAGATPGQVRAVILAEAAILAVLGVPLGIGGGSAAVVLLFRVFGRMDTVGIAGISIVITATPLLVGALTGTLAVLASALLPSLIAGSISPLAAIAAGSRQDARPPRRGPLSLLLGRLSVSAELGWINTRRSRKRFAVTVLSMAIAVTLFVAFSFFARLMGMAMSNYTSNRLERDLALYLRRADPDSELTPAEVEEIARIPGVTEVLSLRYGYAVVHVPGPVVLPALHGLVADGQTPAQTVLGSGTSAVAMDLFGLGRQEMQGTLAGVLRGSPGLLLWPKAFHDGSTPDALDLEPGDMVALETAGGEMLELPVTGIVDQPPSARNLREGVPALLVSAELFRHITGRDTVAAVEVRLAPDADRAAALDALGEMAERAPQRAVVDTVDQHRAQRGVMTQLGILFFGLVAVVALIGGISIVNTVSTNIILRTWELGTLRAAGMTPGQLRAMVILEGVFTALVAAILGCAAGAGLARFLFTQVNELQGVPWFLPWGNMGIAAAAAVLVGAGAALLPFRRVVRMSVVEAIRLAE